MKFIPILFSPPMVQAILSGAKTQTRRTTSLDKINEEGFYVYSHNSLTGEVPHPAKKYEDAGVYWLFHPHNSNGSSWVVQCPYGNVGDILWVRETFADGYNQCLDPNVGKEEKDWTMRYVTFKDGSQKYSDGGYCRHTNKGTEEGFKHIKWRPSIFMPKWACRTFLKIKDIRIERLKDISQEDCLKEGVEGKQFTARGPAIYRDYEYKKKKHDDPEKDPYKFGYPSGAFNSLWRKINGKESFDSNPWLWVIEFEKVELTPTMLKSFIL